MNTDATPNSPRILDEVISERGVYSMMTLPEVCKALGYRHKTRQGAYDALRKRSLPTEITDAVVKVGREYRVPTPKVLRYLGVEVPSPVDALPKAV